MGKLCSRTRGYALHLRYQKQKLLEETRKAFKNHSNPDSLDKVKPPFPNLPSFLIDSTILKYFGYHDAVNCILARLSHNSRAYAKKHAEFLNECIKYWRAVRHFGDVMDFGDTKQKITSVIPNENDTEKITSFRQIKIKAIQLQTTKITVFGKEQEMICGILLDYTGKIPMRWLVTEGHVSERKLTRIPLD